MAFMERMLMMVSGKKRIFEITVRMMMATP